MTSQLSTWLLNKEPFIENADRNRSGARYCNQFNSKPLTLMARLFWFTLSVCLCSCSHKPSLPELADRGWQAYLRTDMVRLNEIMADADRIDERSDEARFLRGLFLVRSGNPGVALIPLRGVMASPSLQTRVLVAAAQAYYDLRQFAAVKQVLETALQISQDDVEAHRLMAALYYDLGANPQAIHHLESVARLDPRDARPHRLIGLMRKDFQDYPAAVAAYREALSRQPAPELADEIRLELAQSLVEQRDHAAAIETLSDTDNTPEALAVRIRCHRALDQASQLVAAVAAARTVGDSPVVLLLELGDYLESKGDLEGAIECFERAVSLAPKDFIPRYKLAAGYTRTGREIDARRELDASQKNRQLYDQLHSLQNRAMEKPLDADLRFQIGQAAEALGRSDLARAWYSAALGLDPQHSLARSSLKLLPPYKPLQK